MKVQFEADVKGNSPSTEQFQFEELFFEFCRFHWESSGTLAGIMAQFPERKMSDWQLIESLLKL
jgi:hypothetical protein